MSSFRKLLETWQQLIDLLQQLRIAEYAHDVWVDGVPQAQRDQLETFLVSAGAYRGIPEAFPSEEDVELLNKFVAVNPFPVTTALATRSLAEADDQFQLLCDDGLTTNRAH